MKYKLKTILFKNGRKEYIAYKKRLIGWASVKWNGNTGDIFDISYTFDSRSAALHAIDLNFAGNTKVQDIIIEIIVK